MDGSWGRQVLDAAGPFGMLAVPCGLAACFFATDARSRGEPAGVAWAEGGAVALGMVVPLLVWWTAGVAVVWALRLRSPLTQGLAAGLVCAAMIAPTLVSSLSYAADQDAWRSAPVGLGIAVGICVPVVTGVLWAMGVGMVRYPSMVRAVRAELAAEAASASGPTP